MSGQLIIRSVISSSEYSVKPIETEAYLEFYDATVNIIQNAFYIHPSFEDEYLKQIDFNSNYNLMVFNSLRKEELFITAIRNLRKKISWITLNNDFQNGDISEKEFDHELEQYPHKYIIDVKLLSNEADINILHDIIIKVDDGFTIDDVSEVFSLDVTGCSGI